MRMSVLGLLAELKTCSSPKDLLRLKTIHASATQSGCDSVCHVANTLVSMYAKCGSLLDARKLFDKLGGDRTVVSWNALIFGYAVNGEEQQALELFATMAPEGFLPNDRTVVAALKACTGLAVKEKAENHKAVTMRSFQRGMALHTQAAMSGYDSNVYVGSILVDLYAKCGSLIDARRVFEIMAQRNVVCWNALLFGYVENGEEDLTLKLFERMQQEQCAPNARTFVAALQACTMLAEKEQGHQVGGTFVKTRSKQIGRQLHVHAVKEGCNFDMYLESSLVNMYAKCGSMREAQEIFDRREHRDVVLWTSLILGYADNGEAELALNYLSRMRREGYVPDWLLYVAALKACGISASLQLGKQVHAEICVQGLDSREGVVCSLVDFYSKCGSMAEAQSVFDAHPSRNLVAWTSLMAGYGRKGDTRRVFDLFERMSDLGIRPDGITFLTILTACNHAGLVDRGKECFHLMSSKHGVSPEMEHYVCMVDMLGRANQLHNALRMLQCMPVSADAVAWRALLGAAHKWKNGEVAKLAFESLVQVDGGDVAAYVLMTSVYRQKRSELTPLDRR